MIRDLLCLIHKNEKSVKKVNGRGFWVEIDTLSCLGGKKNNAVQRLVNLTIYFYSVWI